MEDDAAAGECGDEGIEVGDVTVREFEGGIIGWERGEVAGAADEGDDAEAAGEERAAQAAAEVTGGSGHQYPLHR